MQGETGAERATTLSEVITEPSDLTHDFSPVAFLWHDGCWELFQEHFSDGELDFDRLYLVCQLWTPRSCYPGTRAWAV